MCAPQPCFVFTHPSDARTVAEIGATDKSRSFRPGPFPDPPRDLLAGAIDNSRVAQLSFDVPLGGELHGFIGYFHSTLWDDGSEAVHISTEPSTESVGMFSWFPLFIPLRTPVLVPEGGRVEAAFWRNASRHRVWYEWALTEPQPSPIHNPNGRSYHIGL